MTTTATIQDFNNSRFSSTKLSEIVTMSDSTDSSISNTSPISEQPETSASSQPQIEDDDPAHVYTNIREIEDANSRPIPPTPKEDAQPKRDLQNGWFEYETDFGRTFFYNQDTGKSQWIPPRMIRTPAQVQAFLRATKSDIDEKCTFEGPSSSSVSSSDEQKENKETLIDFRKSSIEDEEVFDEVCEEDEEVVETREPDDDFSDDDFEEESDDEQPNHAMMPHPNPEKPYFIPPDASTPISASSITSRRISPTSFRSVSFQNKCTVLKNVPMPHVLPTSSSLDRTPDRGNYDDSDCETTLLSKCQERRGSSESREPVRTIKCGSMERSDHISDENIKIKKREWLTNYMYLTSAHLILYKDQKSAEKHGKHYDAPMGVWDLRGAKVTWMKNETKKKRKVIQLELLNLTKFLLRTSNDSETFEWFKALEDVVIKLPTPGSSSQSVIDSTNASVVRNPSYLGSTRPLSHALIPISRSIRRRDDPMSQSAIEPSSSTSNSASGTVVEESRPSKETILEKLRRFFRTRPTVETLKEKGIYKPEPVFGSTLAIICQHESSFVPKFIRVITEVIESKGLETDGIYRVSGNLSAVQKIRCQADQDNYKALVAEEDIHVLTGALKLFFRELGEPLFPIALHKEYTSAMQTPNATSRFKKFEELLNRLPNENRETLKVLLRHLNRVSSHSSQNRMQQHNLAIVFGPTLFHNGDGANAINGKNGKKAAKKGKTGKKDDPVSAAQVQSNSHLAFSMIMQSQIVQYLLESANKFDILKSPINYGRQ
ncbi:unnamed protein product [Caenorhabditis angaria]|uniref:Uncharacterized protein n=1 Tax=Caenorhabditis angaria TaxID=860376 RepID=A0A9P1MYE9_9PELO|nr:unnamed protein product [Caenorhabditis angaria]